MDRAINRLQKLIFYLSSINIDHKQKNQHWFQIQSIDGRSMVVDGSIVRSSIDASIDASIIIDRFM